MNNIELGRKIREIRIAKHMTQNDVAGTFITRNMLSQIENGVASPSIKTLEHISKVLEVPLEQLVSVDTVAESPDYSTGTDTNLPHNRSDATDYLHILSSAKDMFNLGNYTGTVSILTDFTAKSCPIYDEVNALLARSYYELSVLSQRSGDTANASSYAHKAVELAGIGIYASDELMMKAFRIIKDSDIK